MQKIPEPVSEKLAVRVAVILFTGAWLIFMNVDMVNAAGMHHGPAGPVPVETLIKNPSVPFTYSLGLQTFQNKCAACHGQWAEGVAKKGPPLVHPYYRPSHHPDYSFYRAAMSGVKQHHWHFGDMPPVDGITKKDVAAILRFIRWWQVQNGIK